MPEHSELITKVGKILSRQKNPDRHTLVSIFKPEHPEAKRHGVIYIVMEILSSDPTMGRVAKLIEKILIEKYYENMEDGLASFEDALKAVNEKLSELADEGEIGWIGKINSVIAILENNILHITQTGTTEAYMIRDGKIMHITENLSSPSEKPNPLKTFINIVSGDLKIGDKVIISTSELFYHFSLDDIRRICAKFSPAIAAAYIVKMLRKEEIESINTLVLEIDEREGEFNIEEIGKKIFSTSEQKIVEGYKSIAPFWHKFLKFSRKGLDTSIEKSKDIYGNKISPSISKFTQEANKKVNERIEKMSEKTPEIPIRRKTKSERDLADLTLELRKSAGAEKPQRNLFDKPNKKNILSGAGDIGGDIIKKAKSKSPVFVILGLLLIVLLVVSGFVSYRQKVSQEKHKKIEQEYTAIKTKVESAIKAYEFGDSEKAQSLLEEARKNIASFPSSTYRESEIAELEKKINNSMEGIFNIKRFDDLSPIVDFSKLDPTIKLTNVFKIDNKIYTIDKERHKSAVFNLEDQATEYSDNLSFDGTGQKICLLSDKSSIALLTKDPSGVYVYNSKTNTTEKATQITGDEWPLSNAISSYMNNIYLLVPGEAQVFKYSSLVGSYSNKSNYIINAGSAKIEDAVDIAIDGYIYILLNNGNVARFLSGEKDEFMVRGLPSNGNEKEKNQDSIMIDPIRIITNADMTNLYIADSGAKRVVVFEKEKGQYQTQYTSSKWTDIKDIWISYESKKLYVLSGSEVYEVGL